jgi:hypothetical protein
MRRFYFASLAFAPFQTAPGVPQPRKMNVASCICNRHFIRVNEDYTKRVKRFFLHSPGNFLSLPVLEQSSD